MILWDRFHWYRLWNVVTAFGVWTQCFFSDGALMLSVADIPMAGLSTGSVKGSIPCLPLKQTGLLLNLNMFPNCVQSDNENFVNGKALNL